MHHSTSALAFKNGISENGASDNGIPSRRRDEPALTPDASSSPRPSDSGVDVLVVDDDAAVRRLVRATLLDDGLTVATAGDGREALEVVAGAAPRVVVVDLEMPVMNGRELIAALRQRAAQPGIVILSAHGARRAGRELHVEATLEKPFDPQDLLDQVRRAGLE